MKRRISFILVVTMMAIALWACDTKAKKEDAGKTEQKTETVVEEKEEATPAGEPEYAYTAVQYDSDYQYFDGRIKCVQLTDDSHPAL